MSPEEFVGPDGKHYDLNALPTHIFRRGNRLYFKAADVPVFEVVIRPGMLPRTVSDWNVPIVPPDRPYV